MKKIIELAHALGDEIAASDEMQILSEAKEAYDRDLSLQKLLAEYETERKLLGEEFTKDPEEADEFAIADLRARIEELTGEIGKNPHYIAFSAAQKALNDLMAEVNAEIRFCITGERPQTCTHDCSTCPGCSH